MGLPPHLKTFGCNFKFLAMELFFTKYSGCGNDFILIDNRKKIFPSKNKTLIQRLCERCTGIGADGVILLENGLKDLFRMRIFNSDGSEAEMCGNGLRCLMKFIEEQALACSCQIETMLRPLKAEVRENLVSIEMGPPLDLQLGLELEIQEASYTVHYVHTGVPHLVILTKLDDEIDLRTLGPKFRYHPRFAPNGCNFNVCQIMKNGELRNRTYERGVEKETLACGTGCAASAIAANIVKGIPSPIKVWTASSEFLEISFLFEDKKLNNVYMTGPATKVFSGQINII